MLLTKWRGRLFHHEQLGRFPWSSLAHSRCRTPVRRAGDGSKYIEEHTDVTASNNVQQGEYNTQNTTQHATHTTQHTTQHA